MWGKIVKEGLWKYEGIDLKVWITLHDIAYGSGDDADPDDISQDHDRPTYYVWFEPAGDGKAQGGGQFVSLNEAINKAEKTLSPNQIFWKS